VSETLSPCKIVYRHKLDFAKPCRLPFGMYCEVHNEPMPTNHMVTCSTPAIVLCPMGNLQGTYKFFSLATGKKVKRRMFTPYPMPDLIMRKVEVYGKSTTLPGSFDFADRNSILFEWNEEVDKFPKGIIKIKDVVLYPSLAMEHPRVLGETNPSRQSRRSLFPRDVLKTPLLATPTLNRLTSQERWRHHQSYPQTQTNLTTTRLMMTTAS
jgi:hypothetical protein